jgi:UPF0271 protein
MMRDIVLFENIIKSIASYSSEIKLMILSTSKNSLYEKIALRYNIRLLYELFADRNYTDEGALVPRGEPDAVIEDVAYIVKRIEQYQQSGILYSIHGKALFLEGDSLCVHGDTAASLAVIKALRDVL